MLSERERQILDGIEASIARESPRLVRRLRSARLDSRWRRRRYDLTVVCSLVVAVLCLLLAVSGTLAAAGVAGGLAVVTMMLRHWLFPYSRWQWVKRYGPRLVD